MRVIKVRDLDNDGDAYVVVSCVDVVRAPNDSNDWWRIETVSEYTDVNEVDARRVLAALEYSDPATLSPSELQAEWERTEAWFTRLGAEMTRRARGE